MIGFLFSIWQLLVFLCWASYLMRGRICNLLLQLLRGLARAVTLGSKSSRTLAHILMTHLSVLQPGGPGPRSYIRQEQGGPVIHPDAGFPLRRLLRLAGLRWTYSNSPPHGIDDSHEFEFDLCCDRWSVGQFILVSGPIWDRWPDFKFLWGTITFFILGL
jgi:hypothetical protein